VETSSSDFTAGWHLIFKGIKGIYCNRLFGSLNNKLWISGYPHQGDKLWTCIALSDILAIKASAEDKRVVELSTRHRAYKFRAANASDKDMWILNIAKHTSLYKERALLRRAEKAICSAENIRSSEELEFLEECGTLNGTLNFTETRDLLVDYADYFRLRYSKDIDMPYGAEDIRTALAELSLKLQLPNLKNVESPLSISILQVDDSYQSPTIQDSIPASYPQSNEPKEMCHEDLYHWVHTTLFPNYQENETFQRRVAQLVASRFASLRHH